MISADSKRARKADRFTSACLALNLDPQEVVRFHNALAEVIENRQIFLDFKFRLTANASAHRVGLDATVELDSMSRTMSQFHQMFLPAYFPDLVDETLRTRTDQTNRLIRRGGIFNRTNRGGAKCVKAYGEPTQLLEPLSDRSCF